MELAALKGHNATVRCVAMSSAGTHLWGLSGGDDRKVIYWDLMGANQRWTHMKHDKPVYSVAFDNNPAIGYSRDHVGKELRWDLHNNVVAERAHLVGRIGISFQSGAVAWSPDRKFVVTGMGNLLKLSRADQAQSLHTFTGHSGPVLAVAISGDGQRVVSGGMDGTVRIWDLLRGVQLALLKGQLPTIHAVALSHDGTHVLTAGANGDLRLWKVS